MVRIIAKLDVKPPFVVKPVHFEGLRKMGLSETMACKYYNQGADEIYYIDIVSSLYQRSPLLDDIEKVANELYVPLAVGGGVRSVNDFSKLLHRGADKVVVNTFAVQEDPNLINKASKIFGAQAVVVNIEAKKLDGSWNCYTDCGRIPSKKNVIEWAIESEQRGAGEILLQCVDSDGRRRGFNIELAKKVIQSVNIPVVIASGAGSLEDIKELIITANPSGIAIASLFHYDKLTVLKLKYFLKENGIKVAS